MRRRIKFRDRCNSARILIINSEYLIKDMIVVERKYEIFSNMFVEFKMKIGR